MTDQHDQFEVTTNSVRAPWGELYCDVGQHGGEVYGLGGLWLPNVSLSVSMARDLATHLNMAAEVADGLANPDKREDPEVPGLLALVKDAEQTRDEALVSGLTDVYAFARQFAQVLGGCVTVLDALQDALPEKLEIDLLLENARETLLTWANADTRIGALLKLVTTTPGGDTVSE